MEGYGFYFYAEDFEGSDSEEEQGLNDKKTKIKPEFEGIFEKGMRSEGTMRYSNGDTFIGLFDREGLKTQGNIMYANGDEFAGDFEGGAKKRGTQTFKSGDEYSGEFVDGVFEGAGRIVYANGDVYCGEFLAGGKHGAGILTLVPIKNEQDGIEENKK